MAEGNSLLEADYQSQIKVVHRLIDDSHADGDFYLMLVLSTLVTTLGLLLNNASIVIGGMLIAPLLTPILALGMGVVTSSQVAIQRSIKILLRSILLILGISFLMALLLGLNLEDNQEILSRIRPTLPYIYVALVSGVAAAFSWVRPRLSATLPGVAVSVALLPPLAVSGIGLTKANSQLTLVTGSFQLFLINFIGIVLASVLVFALQGFYRVRWEEERKIEQELAAAQEEPAKSQA